MATYHAKNGRFTSSKSAHTVTRGGERFKMVRQLRRIGGKPQLPPEPEDDVADTVEAAKAKEEVALLLTASPGWIPLHGVVEAAFGEIDEAMARGVTSYDVPSPVKFAKKLSPEERAERIQMYKDVIAMNKEMGRPVPREWLKGLAELEAGEPKGSGFGWVYSDKVFGHPQATNISGYQNLIPIKVKSGDVKTVDRFIDRAQKILDKLQKEVATIDARAKGRMGTPAQKKSAKATMKSHNFTEKLAVVDMLRKETMKELYSLRKGVAGK